MEKNWFIYAYPDMYGGLHGMYNYNVAFDLSYEEACNWGAELAYETVRLEIEAADNKYKGNDFPILVAKRDCPLKAIEI